MNSFVFVLFVLISGLSFSQNFEHLAVGEKAIDFSITTLQGEDIELSEIYKNQPVVLVILRGFPGYQCPICSRQVGSLLAEADKFAEKGAAVIMVYPGPSEQMQEHASEFSNDFDFPENFYFTLDPDYSVINKYGLRWDEPKETAYPSTFVINKMGEIIFSKISEKHGGRSKTDEVLEVLSEL